MAMTNEQLHDLAPGYALDALDEEERRAFEAHLDDCARCREEVSSLGEAAGALALASEGPVPPAALRARIVDAARAEPTNVVPMRSRRRLVAAGALAAAAAAALALGLWAALDQGPGTTRVALRGADGALVVDDSGRATMEIAQLASAPAGKDYEIWVIEDGTPQRAGTFEGGGRVVVRLDRAVRKGATVAVTLEPDGGLDRPTGWPNPEVLFSASV
jgi:anti-sigma-K factor RskA